ELQAAKAEIEKQENKLRKQQGEITNLQNVIDFLKTKIATNENSTFDINNSQPSTSTGIHHESRSLRKTSKQQNNDTVDKSNDEKKLKPINEKLETIEVKPEEDNDADLIQNEAEDKLITPSYPALTILKRRPTIMELDFEVHNGNQIRLPVDITTKYLHEECRKSGFTFNEPLPQDLSNTFKIIEKWNHIRIVKHLPNGEIVYMLNKFMVIGDSLALGL
ncbi:unnamed protein product, partial [Allacma fusca]